MLRLKYHLYKSNIFNSALFKCESLFFFNVNCIIIRDTLFQETSFITLLNVHKIIHGSKEITKDQNIILYCAVSRLKSSIYLNLLN